MAKYFVDGYITAGYFVQSNIQTSINIPTGHLVLRKYNPSVHIIDNINIPTAHLILHANVPALILRKTQHGLTITNTIVNRIHITDIKIIDQ